MMYSFQIGRFLLHYSGSSLASKINKGTIPIDEAENEKSVEKIIC
jgi:hypothetical protein